MVDAKESLKRLMRGDFRRLYTHHLEAIAEEAEWAAEGRGTLVGSLYLDGDRYTLRLQRETTWTFQDPDGGRHTFRTLQEHDPRRYVERIGTRENIGFSDNYALGIRNGHKSFERDVLYRSFIQVDGVQADDEPDPGAVPLAVLYKMARRQLPPEASNGHPLPGQAYRSTSAPSG